MEHGHRTPPIVQHVSTTATAQPALVWLHTLLIPLLLGIGGFTLYLLTLVQAHTFDALSYALDVERKPLQELFHPHHLAYGLIGVLVRELATTLGWQGNVVLPLQLANALVGAVGVMLFYTVLRQHTHRTDVALAGAVLLGSSFAYWYYAVEVEVYTIAAVFLVGCLGLMWQALRHPTWHGWVWLGVGQGLAVLFHQTNVLLAVPIGATLILATGAHVTPRTPRRYLLMVMRYGASYAIPLGLVVGASYLLAIILSDLHSLAEVRAWTMSYAQTGWWGGSLADPQKWADLGRALSVLLVHPYGAVALIILSGLLLRHTRALLHTYRPEALVLLLWLFSYGLFFYWWEPANIEFWIAILPPAYALLALALAASGGAWHAGVWLALALAGAMATLNFHEVRFRGSGVLIPQYQITSALARNSQAGDLLIVPDGLQKLYLNYYAERLNTLSLNQTLHASGGNWDTACQEFHAHIEATLHGGAAVLISSEVLTPTERTTPYSDPLIQRFALDPATVQACFAPYQAAMQAVPLDAAMPTFFRIPSPQELLIGDGWNFTQGPAQWGWQLHNGRDAFFNGDGWGFFPLDDPNLVSPRMQIDTRLYRGIEVRLARAVANREAQIFFMDQAGIIEEARSVRWELTNHSRLKTYFVDLEGHPSWTGTITGIRLDPTNGRDAKPGEYVQVAWIKLIPYGE